jgi:hypothetical protein
MEYDDSGGEAYDFLEFGMVRPPQTHAKISSISGFHWHPMGTVHVETNLCGHACV